MKKVSNTSRWIAEHFECAKNNNKKSHKMNHIIFFLTMNQITNANRHLNLCAVDYIFPIFFFSLRIIVFRLFLLFSNGQIKKHNSIMDLKSGFNSFKCFGFENVHTENILLFLSGDNWSSAHVIGN